MRAPASSNLELTNLLRAIIRERGPISFATFMDLALYHPEFGYYSSGRAAIGRRGDYFTSVSVGPLFGTLLAAQFAEIWAALDRPNEFVIVEQGAHDGVFARDVLAAMQQREPDCFAHLRYRITEPFPLLRARQRETLADFHVKLEWQDSIQSMPPFSGVHFSNEFLDALPTHRLVAGGEKNRREWWELRVGLDGDDFCFSGAEPNDEKLLAQIEQLPAPPNDDYETEVNLNALAWMETVAPKLERGVILIVDYGLSRAKFYTQERSRGTLQSYSEHRALRSPFEKIGASDLTAHVEWTSLAERAESCGLTIAGFCDQHHFFTGLLAKNSALAASSAKQNRALQTLLHPEFLGTRFQFLGLTKNFSGSLGGFAFARDGRARLGLTPND